MLLVSLIRHRQNDSFADNYFFLVMLPAFLIAKNVLLSADHFPSGIDMTMGLFRLAFLVMFERTLTQFMRNVFSVEILRNPVLDTTIKSLAVLLVPASFMAPPVAGWISLLLALLMLGRFARAAAVFGIFYLALMYILNPPHFGHTGESHFLYIDRNVVEICMLVCVMAWKKNVVKDEVAHEEDQS